MDLKIRWLHNSCESFEGFWSEFRRVWNYLLKIAVWKVRKLDYHRFLIKCFKNLDQNSGGQSFNLYPVLWHGQIIICDSNVSWFVFNQCRIVMEFFKKFDQNSNFWRIIQSFVLFCFQIEKLDTKSDDIGRLIILIRTLILEENWSGESQIFRNMHSFFLLQVERVAKK